MFVLFVIACALFAATGQTTTVTPEHLTQRAVENEQLRRVQEEALKQMILIRETHISRAKQTNVLLNKLAIRAADYESKMSSLLRSDDGKKLALNKKAVSRFANLQKYPVVDSNEIEVRLDEATSLLSMAQLGADGPEVGYMPSQETLDQINNLLNWAETRLSTLSEHDATLHTLIINLPDSVDVSNAKTLHDAVKEYNDRMKEFLDGLHDEGRQISQEQAEQDLRNTFVDAEIRQLKAEQARIITLMDDKIASIRHDYELQLLEQRQIRDRERLEADNKYQDVLAENDQLRKRADAERQRRNTRATIEIGRIIQETEYERKLALARSREVQDLLAPFIAKGYYQPGLRSGTYEPSPVSLRALQERKALETTVKSLKLLLIYGVTKKDKERPRWSFSSDYDRLNAEQKGRLRQAQQYIIYLDDILVQEGLFSP